MSSIETAGSAIMIASFLIWLSFCIWGLLKECERHKTNKKMATEIDKKDKEEKYQELRDQVAAIWLRQEIEKRPLFQQEEDLIDPTIRVIR